MSARLGSMILETCTAPGASALITLNGPPTGRSSFSSRFTNGTQCYYFIADGLRWESGLGTFQSGPPNGIQRPATVIANSDNNTQRINFPGTSYVYCDAPGEQMVLMDDFAQSTLSPTGGYQRLPGNFLMQWGQAASDSAGHAVITFPIQFPNGPVYRGATVAFAPNQAAARLFVVSGGLVTASQCDYWVADSNGSPVTITFTWLAVGR